MSAGAGAGSSASALLLHLLLLLLLTTLAAADVSSDGAALLAFLTNLPHSPRINWSSTTSPCTWHGVSCNPDLTAVTALRLPAADLAGTIPPNALSRLSSLRVLSLHSNALSGPIPQLSNLTLLRSLYLQNNLLSGQLPSTIAHLGRLTRLDVSNNNLTGVVPFSLNNLTGLTGLFLQHNAFSGSLPSISIANLTDFNVSYNALNGSVPTALQGFPSSSFAGNINLCGGPLPPCKPFFPPVPAPAGTGTTIPSSAHRKRKLSVGLIIAIVFGALLIVLLLLTVLWCACLRKRRSAPAKPPTVKTETAVPRSGDSGLMMSSSSMSKEEAAKGGEKNTLTFVGKGGGYSFDLEDLLRASAEVLGKGTVGTSYKAVLEEGTTVVVKRLKEVAATRREFEQQMEALGRPEVQENQNVLALRAYYYSKDEKLLVFDFLAAGSLSALLHGSRGSGRTPLDWESRMRIALAAGRGLAHLHTSARIVHGNLKASNVLLRDSPDNAALSDYGLVPLFASLPRNSRAAGYRAPEVVETRKPTYKSDVYSLGVLLLELLTGKAPNQASIAGEEGIDLPRWVQSVVREEWTAEVFDVELMRYPNIEEEMVQLLQIAMACVAVIPDSRPDANVVVRMMEDIVRRAEQSEEGQPGSSDEPSKGGTPPAAHTP